MEVGRPFVGHKRSCASQEAQICVYWALEAPLDGVSRRSATSYGGE